MAVILRGFDPISTSKLRSFVLQFRYAIVIEARLGIPSLYFYFAKHSQNCFFCILTDYIHAPVIVNNDNIHVNRSLFNAQI